jgi:hypothetical protein
VGEEQGVDIVPAEVCHGGVDLAMIAHHAVGEDVIEVDRPNLPLAKPLLELALLADRVFVAEHELPDRAETEKRSGVGNGHGH